MAHLDKCYKTLAAAVLRLCAKDIYSERNKIHSPAESDIKSGRCDLFFDMLDLPITKEKFIELSKIGKFN